VIDDEPTQVIPKLTRRDLRRRRKPSRLGMFAGWAGYGVSVFAVILVAAWLAVRGGFVEPSHHAPPASDQGTAPVVAFRPTATTASPRARRSAPDPVTTVPAAPVTTTSTTTPTVVAAAVTPTP